MKPQVHPLGAWSLYGTFALVAYLAYQMGDLGNTFWGVITLMTGGVKEISSAEVTFLMMVPAILAVVALELPSTIAGAFVQGVILGRTGTHSVSEAFAKMTEGNHFFNFFVLCLGEELFARYLFLGLLPMLSFLSGPVAFYALFLIGNGLWALVHLTNFRDLKDRHPLRVLPQFVAGIFYTYIFVKHGLLAAVLAHFASNAIVFAMHKIQRFDGVDAMIIGYASLCVAVPFLLMQKPLTDTLLWFADQPVFELPGWGFWDYVLVAVFVPSCFSVAFGILMYDRGDAGKKSNIDSLIEYVLLIPLTVVVLFGVYWLLGFAIASVPYRIIVLAIIFAFLQKSASGSAMARTFWTGLPAMYIAVCALEALGWWAGMAFVAVSSLVHVPTRVLIRMDD